MALLKKFNPFLNDVIFIDGLWGTGKSIIAPIVGAMDRVEKQKIEHIYEYLCILRFLNKIEADAAETLLITYADLSQYNNIIGREVNLRWNDDSGLRNNPNSLRYLQRLFGREGDAIVEGINENNLALNVMSHMIAQVSDPLVKAYGSRLRIIEMVRHPVYLVQHWYSYLSRFDSERVFTMSIDYDGQKVPWFASSWQDKFVKMSVMDRSLYSVSFLYDLLFKSMDNLSKKNAKVLVISFESFVLNTKDELERLEEFLDRPHSLRIKQILKQQRVPRKTLLQGKGHAGYGWKHSEAHSEEEEYGNQLEFIRKKASKDILEEFNSLITTYNKKWPSVLNYCR